MTYNHMAVSHWVACFPHHRTMAILEFYRALAKYPYVATEQNSNVWNHDQYNVLFSTCSLRLCFSRKKSLTMQGPRRTQAGQLGWNLCRRRPHSQLPYLSPPQEEAGGQSHVWQMADDRPSSPCPFLWWRTLDRVW
jgi:transposase InsO family protein